MVATMLPHSNPIMYYGYVKLEENLTHRSAGKQRKCSSLVFAYTRSFHAASIYVFLQRLVAMHRSRSRIPYCSTRETRDRACIANNHRDIFSVKKHERNQCQRVSDAKFSDSSNPVMKNIPFHLRKKS